MVKKWTKPIPGEDLMLILATIGDKLGPYPHAKMNLSKKSKGEKPGSRLIKVACPKCGYVARVTRKWLDDIGAPICPSCKVAFKEEEKK